jgi:hypothetical protein
MVGSSGCTDGTVGTLAAGLDGVDRWGATYDPLKLVAAAGNGSSSPCAWVVLRSPAMVNGQQYYMCLSYSTLAGTVQAYQCNVRWAKNAFTIAATPTWPPVAPADAWNFDSAALTTVWRLNNGSTVAHRVNAILSANGDFMMYWTRSTYGQSETVLAAMMPTARRASDQYPLFTCSAYSSSVNVSVFNTYYSSAGVSFTNSNGARMFDNSGVANNEIISFQAQGDGQADYVDASILDFPAWIIGHYTTSRLWMRGRLSDFGVIMGGTSATSYSAPSGSVIRDGGNNIVYATQGGILLPANAIPDMS